MIPKDSASRLGTSFMTSDRGPGGRAVAWPHKAGVLSWEWAGLLNDGPLFSFVPASPYGEQLVG